MEKVREHLWSYNGNFKIKKFLHFIFLNTIDQSKVASTFK